MRVSILYTVLATFSAAGALSGAPAEGPSSNRKVEVALTVPAGAVGEVRGTVTLRALMGPQTPLSAPINAARKVSFDVTGHTMWEATISANGWWAPPITIAVQDGNVEMPVPLLPTGRLKGHLAMPQGASAPNTLSVALDVMPGDRKLPGPPSTEAPCSLRDSEFICDLPVGTLDLTFHAAGYVPLYRWDVAISAQRDLDVGTLSLQQGSSVTGTVKLANGRIENGKGQVALFRPTMGTNATALRLSRPLSISAVSERGFFQLTGVPAGRYVLEASYPGYVPETVEGVQVYERVEAKLRRPIELEPPIALTFNVTPPIDFKGTPWKIELYRASKNRPGKYDGPIVQQQVKDGRLSVREQQGGRYQVEVLDSDGNPFLSEEFATAGMADEVHNLKISALHLRGTVKRGDRPLKATVWFGGQYGAEHVAFASDTEGSFEGMLPRVGSWRVQIDTDATSTELKTNVTKDDHDEARVDLVIPDNHISGVVVDQSGSPLTNAEVSLRLGSVGQTDRTTDAGTFAFDGVPPGEFTLEADILQHGVLRVSEIHGGSIGEHESLDGIVLKVKDGQSLHGRILGPEGPVVGAEIKLRHGTGLDLAPVSTATSGADGTFDVSTAPGYTRAIVTVAAPGYALRVFDIALDGHAATLNLPQVGGTLRIRPPKDANGLFFFQDGRYLSYVDVAGWMRIQGAVAPSVGASFEVSDVSPGQYRVCTLTPNARSIADLTKCADGFLPPYGELELLMH